MMESYRLERLAIWRNPEAYEKGFQTIQGLYAISTANTAITRQAPNDMVVRRFLSVLYPPAVYEQVNMEGTAAGETFAASGRIVKSEIGRAHV